MRLIVDGPYLSHRSYLAPYKLTTSEGLDSTLIHTFFRSLFKLEKEHNPSEVIFTWEAGLSWRRKLLKTYKPPKPPDRSYTQQMVDTKGILSILGYRQVMSLTNEADDCIATLVCQQRVPTNIFTVDKDIMQLITDRIPIRVICNDKTMSEQSVIEKFNVLPSQIPDYLALVGDSSDNIKGITGIGPVKASQLLKEYKTLDHIPLTREQREIAFLNRKLTRLNRKAILQEIGPSPLSLNEYLDKYELKQLKEKLNEIIRNI